MSDTAISDTLWPDAWFSSYERPVHSKPKPAGRSFEIRAISAIASPVERPAAAVPEMFIEG